MFLFKHWQYHEKHELMVCRTWFMLDEVMRHCHVASMGNFQVTAIHHPLHLRLNISYILKLRRCASFLQKANQSEHPKNQRYGQDWWNHSVPHEGPEDLSLPLTPPSPPIKETSRARNMYESMKRLKRRCSANLILLDWNIMTHQENTAALGF